MALETLLIDIVNLNFSASDFAVVAGGASPVVLTALGLNVRKIKNRLTGVSSAEENTAKLARHAETDSALTSFLGQKNAPHSILMEGADLVYFAVRGQDPPILKLDVNNKKHIMAFQQILLHLDKPDEAYRVACGIANGEIEPDNKVSTKHCAVECAELSERLRKRQQKRSLIGKKYNNDELNDRFDKSMLKQVEALLTGSKAMTGIDHIAIRHHTESAKRHLGAALIRGPFSGAPASSKSPEAVGGGHIVTIKTTSQFRKAFEHAHGDLGTFRHKDDNELLNNILQTRLYMAENHPGRLKQCFEKAVALTVRPVKVLVGHTARGSSASTPKTT